MKKQKNTSSYYKGKKVIVETNGVNLKIFKKTYLNRGNQLSKNWYGRWSIDSKEKEISSGETNFKLAKNKLIEKVIETNIRKKQGLAIYRNKFDKLYFDIFLNDKEHNSLSKSRMKEMRARGNVLQRYMNNIEVDRINKDKVQTFINQRKVALNNQGKKISEFSVKNDVAVLRKFLNWCFENGYVKTKFEIKTKWIARTTDFVTQKVYFTKDEWDKIKTTNLREIKETDNRKLKFQKQYLHSLMSFLLNTGMRLGEVYKMKWSDLDLIEGKTQSDYSVRIRIGAERKTGVRTINGFSGSYFALVNLKRNYETFHNEKLNIDSEELVFKQHSNAGFNSLLKRCNLKFKTQGKRILTRDLSVFRHTFITWFIHRYDKVHEVAKHCGTSTDMIDKHYTKHLNTELLDNKLSGWGNLKSLK